MAYVSLDCDRLAIGIRKMVNNVMNFKYFLVLRFLHLLSSSRVGRTVRPSVSNSCPLYNSFTNERISFKLEWHIHLN